MSPGILVKLAALDNNQPWTVCKFAACCRLTELRIAAGSLISCPVHWPASVLLITGCTVCFSCSDSENEINRQAASPRSLSQPVLNPILFASLQGGIWMTWSISNQERPEAFSLVVMEFPTNLLYGGLTQELFRAKGRWHAFLASFFFPTYLSPWVGMMADNLPRGSAVR